MITVGKTNLMQDTQICSYWLGYKLYRSDLYSIIFYKILKIIMMTWLDCSFSKDLILQFIIVEWWTNDRGGWPWPGGGNHWMIICNLSEEIICIVILIISLTTAQSLLSSPFLKMGGLGRLKGAAGAADDDHFPRHMARWDCLPGQHQS